MQEDYIRLPRAFLGTDVDVTFTRAVMRERATAFSCIYPLKSGRINPGLVRICFEEDEDHHAGDRNVEPNGESEACDSAVHREAASEREKECREHHRKRDHG